MFKTTPKPRTVIVTGASGGIGGAVAEAFADAGDNLVLSGTRAEALEARAQTLPMPERVLSVAGDLARAEDRARLVDGALARFGRIDVLVNNAGLFAPRPFLEVDEDELDRYLAVNLKGTFFLTQAVVRRMAADGGGAIVNIGTVLVEHALGGVPASAPVATKGAIHALTRQLAAEFGAADIRVNTIAPGIIRTPLHARNGIEDADALAGLHLLGRIGEPEAIAEAALHLAANPFVTGATLDVDGGHASGHAVG